MLKEWMRKMFRVGYVCVSKCANECASAWRSECSPCFHSAPAAAGYPRRSRNHEVTEGEMKTGLVTHYPTRSLCWCICICFFVLDRNRMYKRRRDRRQKFNWYMTVEVMVSSHWTGQTTSSTIPAVCVKTLNCWYFVLKSTSTCWKSEWEKCFV